MDPPAPHLRIKEVLYFGGEVLHHEDVKVLFDDGNRQLLMVKGDQELKAIPVDQGFPVISNRLANRGSILGLKLSPNRNVAALQRSLKSVELLNVKTNTVVTLNCKSSKSSTKILGFCWVQNEEMVIVTTNGVEFFQVPLDKPCRLGKSYVLNVNWFVYSVETRILMVSTGAAGNSIQPFHFKDGLIHRLPKFDIAFVPMSSDPHQNKNQRLTAKEVTLHLIYGRIYCAYYAETIHSSELHLYMLTREEVSKRYTLQLGTKGDIGFNVIDNLLVVHSLTSKTSMIFDVKAPAPGGIKGPVVPPLPVVSAGGSIKHLHGSSPEESRGGSQGELQGELQGESQEKSQGEPPGEPPTYARDWMAYYPDFIVSPQLGFLWTISINLDNVMDAFTDKTALLDFLLRRRDSRSLILRFFQATLESRTSPSIVAGLFDQLNVVCSTLAPEQAYDKTADAKGKGKEQQKKPTEKIQTLGVGQSLLGHSLLGQHSHHSAGDLSASLPAGAQKKTLQRSGSSNALRSFPQDSPQKNVAEHQFFTSLTSGKPMDVNEMMARMLEESSSKGKNLVSPRGLIVIDQESMYHWVFSRMESQKLPYRYMVSIILEYLKSLNTYYLPVNHVIYEFLINLLVANGCLNQLQQMFHYQLIRDSVRIAGLLLSLEGRYPMAYQLAIDMLKRLGAKPQVIEVLLLKKDIMAVLRYIRGEATTLVEPAVVLEAAMSTGDDLIFYNTFKFFEERNLSQTGKAQFPLGDCGKFVDHYNETFADGDTVIV